MDMTKTIAVCTTVFLVSCVGSCTAESIYEKHAIAQAISSGADPIDVTCAMRGSVYECPQMRTGDRLTR